MLIRRLLNIIIIWSHSIRLYIAVGIVLYTLESWWWASVTYSGTPLFAIRLEELYAWTAVSLLAIAVTIGPVYSVCRNLPGKHLFYNARRLLGIGAAWFSMLHIVIAYRSSFGLINPLSLPQTYQRTFAVGALGAVILLAMALTSFDAAFHRMGKWWFRLHRLVYVAVISILLHAMLIGVHATDGLHLVIVTLAAVIILSLHTYLAFAQQKPHVKLRVATVAAIASLLIITLSYGYNKYFHPPLETQSAGHTMDGMDMMHGMQMEGIH